MTVKELQFLLGAKLVAGKSALDRPVSCALTCDLLSWVMAKGTPGMAWISIQTHMNVVAVAALMDMAVILLAERVEMDAVVINKANEEGIAVLSCEQSAFTICCLMGEAGIRAPER